MYRPRKNKCKHTGRALGRYWEDTGNSLKQEEDHLPADPLLEASEACVELYFFCKLSEVT